MKDPQLYTEEVQLGGDLSQLAPSFHPSNRKFALISHQYVIVYDVKTGSRLHVFHHNQQIVATVWHEKDLIALSNAGAVFRWDLAENQLKSSDSVDFDGLFHTSYSFGGALFVVATPTGGKSQVLLEVDLLGLTAAARLTLPVQLKSRKELGVGEGFAALCLGRSIKLLPFDGCSLAGDQEFYFGQHFTGATYNDSIKFESVVVSDDNVFGVLTIGRVYSWQKVSQFGLGSSNRNFFHSHNSEMVIAVTSLLAVFCGTSNCRVDKWNLVTSGRGRYEQFHAMERLEAPVDALWLSADDSLLLAVLSDNSLILLNTASLAVVCRPQSMQWPSVPPLHGVGLRTDIEYPNYVVTNTRHGYIQWVDPAKWRTIAEFDVSKENPPPRDCVTIPEYDWTQVYDVVLSSSLVVTCECKRHDPNKTTIKFFSRTHTRSINDFKFLDSVRLSGRARFVRLGLEEVKHGMELSMAEKQSVVVVTEPGQLLVYHADPARRGGWCADLARCTSWRHTRVAHCSLVRDGLLATVNQVDEQNAFVLLWDLSTMRVLDCLDQVPGARQVAWAAAPRFRAGLLIACDFGVLAYDTEAREVRWAVEEPDLQLYSDRLVSLAFKRDKVFWLDSLTGKQIRKFKFSSPQDLVVATGTEANVRFSGLNEKNLSLMKPETDENETLRDAVLDVKKTPFSALAQLARARQQAAADLPSKRLNAAKQLSARKLLEGPAYTLAPITKLGPAFVEACLLRRRVD